MMLVLNEIVQFFEVYDIGLDFDCEVCKIDGGINQERYYCLLCINF